MSTWNSAFYELIGRTSTSKNDEDEERLSTAPKVAPRPCCVPGVCEQFYQDYKDRAGVIVFGVKTLELFDASHVFWQPEATRHTLSISFMNYMTSRSKKLDMAPGTNMCSPNFSCCYDMTITPTFVENLSKKCALVELHRNESELIGSGDLSLKGLMFQLGKKLTTIVDLYDVGCMHRQVAKRIAKLAVRLQLVLNPTMSATYLKDDIYNSEVEQLLNDDVDDEATPYGDNKQDFIEVVLSEKCNRSDKFKCNEKDSLFNVDISASSSASSSSSKQPGHVIKFASRKVADRKRSVDEYALLKGYSATAIKFSKWKESHLLNIPTRKYDMTESKYPAEVVIVITSLTVDAASHVAANERIRQFFVEYNFLGFEGHDMESRLFQKDTGGDTSIDVGFIRSFSINPTIDAKQCRLLARMVRGNRDIEINLVNEPYPMVGQTQTCQIIGTGYVNVFELIQEEENVINLKVPVVGAHNKKSFGYFVVYVRGVQAMRDVVLQMLKVGPLPESSDTSFSLDKRKVKFVESEIVLNDIVFEADVHTQN